MTLITRGSEFGEQVIVIHANSGTTLTYGGYVGELVSGVAIGNVIKSGSGVFEARHFRVANLDVQSGTIKVVDTSGGSLGFPGSNTDTSRVYELAIAGTDTNPTAKLDLSNNDLIIDWSGTDPLGTLNGSGTATGHIARLQTAFRGNGTQIWSGNGITTSTGFADQASYGIAYADAEDFLGVTGSATATFSGVTVDSTSTILKFTYFGDTDLGGDADSTADFGTFGANFKTAQNWTGGDFNYDGFVDIHDAALFYPNFNAGVGDPLRISKYQLIYSLMLDYPLLYWDLRDHTEYWNTYFAQYDLMNMGPIPDRPEGMRSVPEPATIAVVALAALRTRRRR